jgi:HD domain/PilZ domain
MLQTVEESLHLTKPVSSYDQTLETLGRVLDLRDTETAGHSYRVERYTIEIAWVMGCSEAEINDIGPGARLHDIGKIGIPDSILLKPGKLTPAEREVMNTHAWLGYNLLRRLDALRPAAQIVLAHHERYDGKGYPYGIRGRKIPLGARIFAVADTLDAMTTDRPYRAALPLALAYEEIQRESGRQLDPEAVRAFISIPESTIRTIILTEKRRTARMPLRTDVECRQASKFRHALSVNISESGMLLENSDHFDLGQEMVLRFCLPNAPIPIEPEGVAVRKSLPDRVGVQFLSLSPQDRESIRQFIDEATRAGLVSAGHQPAKAESLVAAGSEGNGRLPVQFGEATVPALYNRRLSSAPCPLPQP